MKCTRLDRLFLCFATPSPSLIRWGEKSDTFTDLALAPVEGRVDGVRMGELEKAVELVPADGWAVQSKYGTQRTSSGVDLVRLADVHAWLVGNGKPAKDAVYELFHPILEPLVDHDPAQVNSVGEPPISLGWVWCLNSQTYPEAIFNKGQIGRQENAKLLKQTLPELEHVRFVDGTPGGLMYACWEAARRVWLGGDVSTDPVESFKRKQERNLEEKYGVKWPDDFKLRIVIARLAVPHSVAHELWGWGSKAALQATSNVVPLRVVSPAQTTPNETPATANDVSSYSLLVAWRKVNPSAQWIIEHKKILKKEADRRSKKHGKSKVSDIAQEFSITASRIRTLIRDANTASVTEKKWAR